MSILTSSSARRHYYSVSRLPKRETRIAEKPATPFADGLVLDTPGQHTPIDQRVRPTVEGFGLTSAEFDRITGAQNRARAAYATDCPNATMGEIDRVSWAARKDEFRRVLADRPAAPALKVAEPAKADRWIEVKLASLNPGLVRVDAAAKPVSRPVKTPVRKLAAADRPKPYTALDTAWWAANSPTSQSLYCVEGRVDPSDTYNNTMAADEYRELVAAACFGEPVDLSDDHNGAFGIGGAE